MTANREKYGDPVMRPTRSTYTTLQFKSFRDIDSLAISPKFQRRAIWSLAARSFLIDTIMREMPIPPIYLRLTQDEDRSHSVNEVIDGQQRIRAVLDFIDGNFALSGSLDSPYKGMSFDDLESVDQDKIYNYSFNCEIFSGLNDQDVLTIFERLNTHSISLNAQELRNGRFFGPFKQSAYSLAREHLEHWRLNKLFTERSIARMLEVELTSEMMILQLDGLQDKKKSINQFYVDNDEEFNMRESVEDRFRSIVDVVDESLFGVIGRSQFTRIPLYYSLFAAVYHRRYGLPNFDLETPKKQLSKSEHLSLRNVVEGLSDVLINVRENKGVAPRKWQKFAAACATQTDNVGPRSTRTETIYTQAFG